VKFDIGDFVTACILTDEYQLCVTGCADLATVFFVLPADGDSQIGIIVIFRFFALISHCVSPRFVIIIIIIIIILYLCQIL
jgi:hypothetical protein